MYKEATQRQVAIIEGLKNERLGFMNVTHSLKILNGELRTENGDVRS